MALSDDLNAEVRKILAEEWDTREGRVVPESDGLRLNNDAVELEGAVLYADLDDSTQLVDSYSPKFAAEMYKVFLVTSARIIRSVGGEITAYDGDRVMAVYIGDTKENDAVRTALMINYAVKEIINPAIKDQYPNPRYSLNQVVGVDTSQLFVARTGIRGANDLVWVGRAANYAAKLSGRSGDNTQITREVYHRLEDRLKRGRHPIWGDQSVWSSRTSGEIGYKTIYTTSAWQEF